MPGYYWQPADGHRHAVKGVRPLGGHADGDTVRALCGREVTTAASTTYTWLWLTCWDCHEAARPLAHAPMDQ